MSIYLKSEKEIIKIKKACAIWKKVRETLIKNTKPNVSLKFLDNLANEVITKNNATASFHNYQGFPGYICISVNQELIHGIASDYRLKKNDLVTFDVGVTYDGYYCDAAFSVIVEPSDNQEAIKINEATKKALDEAIKIIKPGITVNDIAKKIYQVANETGYQVVKDFAGHGCGNYLHEDPLIFNYPTPKGNTRLIEDMIICIEPMFMTESDQYIIDSKNQWTVSSANKKLTCHWEHMVLITSDGCEVLTK